MKENNPGCFSEMLPMYLWLQHFKGLRRALAPIYVKTEKTEQG